MWNNICAVVLKRKVSSSEIIRYDIRRFIMKLLRKILSAAISLSISLMTMPAGFTLSADSSRGNNGNDMKYLRENDRNSYSVELFQEFVNNFPSEIVDGSEKTVYPENYGGAYIDSIGALHLKVVEDYDIKDISTDANYYISALKKSSNIVDPKYDVIIDDADVTWNQLLEVQKVLDSVMEELDISSTYTDEENNILVVSLLDISSKYDVLNYLNENINAFSQECVEFEQGSVITPTAYNAYNNALAGSGATSSTGYSATLGFNAYKASSGQYGVVAAAHFATSGTTIYNALGSTIGTPSVRQYSGTLDAAFIPFGSNISPSNGIYQLSSPDDTLTGYYNNSSIIQGMSSKKVGKTSNVTNGSVLSVSTSILTNSNITLTSQFKVSNTQYGGDSGAPAFHSFTGPLQPGATRSNTLIGIVTQADSDNNGYGSKAENILNGLSISFY